MANFKLYTVLGLVVYFLYLFTYKCGELKESPLEHAAQNVLHPLTHTHNQMCDAITKGELFIHPYLLKVEGFLDENVHKSQFFIDYEIASKITFAKTQYYTYAYPLVIKAFEYISIFEKYVYDQSVISYNRGVVLYNSLVAKVAELTK